MKGQRVINLTDNAALREPLPDSVPPSLARETNGVLVPNMHGFRVALGKDHPSRVVLPAGVTARTFGRGFDILKFGKRRGVILGVGFSPRGVLAQVWQFDRKEGRLE